MSEEESGYKPRISRRNFLKGLIAAAGANTIRESGLPILEAQDQSPETESNSFDYEITSVELNPRNGVLEIEFAYFDPRLSVPIEGSTDLGETYKYSPTSFNNLGQNAENILNSIQENLGSIEEYDHLFLVPGQFFPLEQGYTFEYPRGMSDKMNHFQDQTKSFIGGAENFNVGFLNNESRWFSPQENIGETEIHESMHTSLSEFPRFLINGNGETVPISQDYYHLTALAAPDQNGYRWVHPHNDVLGGTDFEKELESISPIQLFSLGLITKAEFSQEFEGGQPFVNKVNARTGEEEKVYYTIEDLIDAYKNPNASREYQVTSINEFRISKGLPSIDDGWDEESEPKKVAIIPVAFYKQGARAEGTYIGNDKTMSENMDAFMTANQNFAEYLNRGTRGRMQAAVLTG